MHRDVLVLLFGLRLVWFSEAMAGEADWDARILLVLPEWPDSPRMVAKIGTLRALVTAAARRRKESGDAHNEVFLPDEGWSCTPVIDLPEEATKPTAGAVLAALWLETTGAMRACARALWLATHVRALALSYA